MVKLPICRHYCSWFKLRTNATLTTAAAADGDTAANATPPLAFRPLFSLIASKVTPPLAFRPLFFLSKG